MKRFEKDKSWSDRFLPTIREIVGPMLLTTAPLELDRIEATDLMILAAKDIRIACRIRRPGYVDKYGHEFTMRSQLHISGGKTEIQKIADGFGTWMFYGHAMTYESHLLRQWMIIDLDVWRGRIKQDLQRCRWGEKRNRDQETSFIWFDARSFPPDPPILVAWGEWNGFRQIIYRPEELYHA